MSIIRHLADVAKGKHPMSAKRSSKWPAVEKEHLQSNPACVVCGSTKKVQVHHCAPFHLHPELELDPHNLVTLCEKGGAVNCHLWFGHLGNFKSFNLDVIPDAETWRQKINNRPLSDKE